MPLKNEGPDTTRIRETSPDEVELIPEGNLAREDMTDFQSWLDRAMEGGTPDNCAELRIA